MIVHLRYVSLIYYFAMSTEYIEIVKIAIVATGSSLAIAQYWSSNLFKLSQQLGELWRRLYEMGKFTTIFQALEHRDKATCDTLPRAHGYHHREALQLSWGKIVDPESVEKEITSPYWQKQYRFSLKCKKRVEEM